LESEPELKVALKVLALKVLAVKVLAVAKARPEPDA
jgi:hypothetical protein